MHVIEEDKYWQ